MLAFGNKDFFIKSLTPCADPPRHLPLRPTVLPSTQFP